MMTNYFDNNTYALIMAIDILFYNILCNQYYS